MAKKLDKNPKSLNISAFCRTTRITFSPKILLNDLNFWIPLLSWSCKGLARYSSFLPKDKYVLMVFSVPKRTFQDLLMSVEAKQITQAETPKCMQRILIFLPHTLKRLKVCNTNLFGYPTRPNAKKYAIQIFPGSSISPNA